MNERTLNHPGPLYLRLVNSPAHGLVTLLVDGTGKAIAGPDTILNVDLRIERVDFTDGTSWPKPFDPDAEEPGIGEG